MYDMNLYRELDALPTLAQGHADDCKLDSRNLDTAIDVDHGADHVLVWISRVEPGEVTAERCIEGRYVDGDDADVEAMIEAARLEGLL